MSRQVKQKVQPNKKKVQIDNDSESLNIDNFDEEDVRSSEINETLKKTQIKGRPAVKSTVKSTVKTTIKPTVKTVTKINKNNVKEKSLEEEETDKDSSDISDIDDNQEISDAFNYDNKKSKSKKVIKNNEDYEDGEENGEKCEEDMDEEYVQTVVMERVIKYVKLDDVIKEKQNEHKKEMKTLKDTKDQLEQFLIGFLDKMNEEYIQLGNKSTLIKTETQTKAAPKMEDISVCLIDGFRKYEIYEDDEEIKRVVKDFIKTIDDKREIKTRKYLKRMAGDPEKKEGDKQSTASVSEKKNVASISKTNKDQNEKINKDLNAKNNNDLSTKNNKDLNKNTRVKKIVK